MTQVAGPTWSPHSTAAQPEVTAPPRQHWDEMIHRALTGVGVSTVFQPIVDLRHRRVVGYEALTRFASADGSPKAPDEVLAAAHELGVGQQLDAVCLQSALARRSQVPKNCFLSLNLDPESLLSAPARKVLNAQGHLGGLLIEITEHRPWIWEDLAPVVRTLRSSGARFAVDDAGSGYAGLKQILQLRPSILKLDRSLVEGVDRDETKVSLIEMLGMFANRIDAWLLAEGVETLGEAQRLVDLEVPLAQGYFFARPEARWAPLDPTADGALAKFAQAPTDTLARLLDPVATVKQYEDLTAGWAEANEPWMAVVDHQRRPTGLINSEAAFRGELIPTLIASVHLTPLEVLGRLSTAAPDPRAPVIVTDHAGHYLGLIPLRRLMATVSGVGSDSTTAAATAR